MLLKDRLAKQGSFLFRRRSFVPLVVIAIVALELFPRNAEAILSKAFAVLPAFCDAARNNFSLSLWREPLPL
jgi:hypothetical protein